jgi:hypothetical protein
VVKLAVRFVDFETAVGAQGVPKAGLEMGLAALAVSGDEAGFDGRARAVVLGDLGFGDRQSQCFWAVACG